MIKMRLEIKTHRYDINRPKPRHDGYTKYKLRYSTMMVIFIKQHLSNLYIKS